MARGAILSGFDPNALLVGRMGLAIVLLLVTMLITNRRHLITDRRCLLLSLAAGLLNGFGMVCYFWGLTLIESSMAAMIISLSPVVVLTLLALRGERFTYRHIILLGLALVGAYLLIGPGGQVNPIGVLLVMIAYLLLRLPARVAPVVSASLSGPHGHLLHDAVDDHGGDRVVVVSGRCVAGARSAGMAGCDRTGGAQHLRRGC